MYACSDHAEVKKCFKEQQCHVHHSDSTVFMALRVVCNSRGKWRHRFNLLHQELISYHYSSCFVVVGLLQIITHTSPPSASDSLGGGVV